MSNRLIVVFGILFSLLFTSISSGQGNPSDPLGRVRDLINSDEIVLSYSQTMGGNPNNQNIRARTVDVDLNQSNPNSRFLFKNNQTDSIVTGNKRIAVTTGNYLGGMYKHTVAAWIGANNSIRLTVPQIIPSSLTWTNSNRLTLPNAIMPSNISPKTPLRLASGNFYGDSKDEFVLGYVGPDSSLKIKLFTLNTSLVPVKGDSINNEKIAFPNAQRLDAFDLAIGDFDGDGYQEIGAVFVKKNGNSWNISVRVYKINSSGSFVSKGTLVLFSPPAYSISNIQISASSKDFNYDAVDDIAAGYAFTHNEQSQPGTYIDIVQIKDSLNTLIRGANSRATLDISNEGESRPFDIAAGDLNGDSKNDIAVATRGNLYAYSVNDSLRPVLRLTGPSIYGWESSTESNSISERILAAADLDYNRKADIVAVSNPFDIDNDRQYFNVYDYEVNDAFTAFILKGRRETFDTLSLNGNTGNLRHFAVALGDFNGDRVRLGAVNHYRKSFVKQPLVILNTPPIHYDIFEPNPASFDLSGCYPNFGCGFSADYIQSSTQDTTIEVQVHNDWGVDATLSAGGNVFGVGVQASITGSYAEGFGNVQGSGKTIRVTEGRTAEGDDMAFNIVNDYDFYEYAVYDSLNNFRGNVITVIPGPTTKVWMESKDDYALGNIYRPEHEVGNILSYKDSMSLSEDTAQLIHQFNPQTVGSSGGSFVQLEMEDFQSSGADTSRKIGVEVGGSVGAWGIEVGVNGSYSNTQVSNVTTKISSSMLLRGTFGHLTTPYNLPQNTYYIIPYAYWAKNGALVLDYKVNLNTNPNSFWAQHYGGKSDLAFALPWRLDPEKGLPLPGNDTAYRFRSKDIRISKMDPQEGDTITIKARISNFGLSDVSAPVTVKFYKGSPSTGGVQIGQTTVNSGFQSRKSKYAVIQWVVPPLTPRSTRIYAVIDQDNSITNEVHENNNIGWAPLSDFSLPVEISASSTIVPDKIELLQNYPNPFNPSTTITFKSTMRANATLKIYDVLGREIRTLVDEKLSPGTYNITWNASGLTSGAYFYRLQIGSYVETKKLMLIK